MRKWSGGEKERRDVDKVSWQNYLVSLGKGLPCFLLSFDVVTADAQHGSPHSLVLPICAPIIRTESEWYLNTHVSSFTFDLHLENGI
ncbi:hypothetical protein MUG91_G12n1 [Manis pentadactyla]|nr:hypothetical protein MUG91_G12n1 [Manis pentadactyla]